MRVEVEAEAKAFRALRIMLRIFAIYPENDREL